MHHVRPYSHGGLTRDDNLVLLCEECEKALTPHEAMLWERIASSAREQDLAQEVAQGQSQYRRIVEGIFGGIADTSSQRP